VRHPRQLTQKLYYKQETAGYLPCRPLNLMINDKEACSYSNNLILCPRPDLGLPTIGTENTGRIKPSAESAVWSGEGATIEAP